MPKLFFDPNDLKLYFSVNQNLLTNTIVPPNYTDIHNLYMSNFKIEHMTAQDVLEQTLWLNKYNKINSTMVYWKLWITSANLCINYIIHNGKYLTNQEIQTKYNIETIYLATKQIQDSIPKKCEKSF